jgi:UDP-glucose 4-epimerase
MAGAGQNEYNRVNVTQTLELAQKAKESAVELYEHFSKVKVANFVFC